MSSENSKRLVTRSSCGINVYDLYNDTRKDAKSLAVIWPLAEHITRAYKLKTIEKAVVIWKNRYDIDDLITILRKEKPESIHIFGTHLSSEEMAKISVNVGCFIIVVVPESTEKYTTCIDLENGFKCLFLSECTKNNDWAVDLFELRYGSSERTNLNSPGEKFYTSDNFKNGIYSYEALLSFDDMDDAMLSCPVVERIINYVNASAREFACDDIFDKGCTHLDCLRNMAEDLVLNNSRRVRLGPEGKFIGNVVFGIPRGVIETAKAAVNMKGIDIGIVVRNMSSGVQKITFVRRDISISMDFVDTDPYNGGGNDDIKGCTFTDKMIVAPCNNNGWLSTDNYDRFEDWFLKM